MTQEGTTETRTVQKYRHDARRSLKSAQQSLALRTEGTREVYTLVNGMIETVIQGRPGYSQEEQVERLTKAHDTLVENMAVLPETIAAAKASVIEQMEAWEATILAKAQEAVNTLAEAKTFAAERDFEAWQATKGRRSQSASVGYEPSPEEDDYSEEDPDDED